jgi:hypothetical protein
VAICPRLEGPSDLSYLMRQVADLPGWCNVSNGNEPFTMGICFPSTSIGTIRHETAGLGHALLLFKSHLVLAHLGSVPDLRWIPLSTVEFVESGNFLSEHWFSLATSDSTYRFRYRTCDEACVQMFLYDLRRRLMTGGDAPGLAQGITCGSPLELKFACAETDELDPEESVLIRFFSRHIRTVSILSQQKNSVGSTLNQHCRILERVLVELVVELQLGNKVDESL